MSTKAKPKTKSKQIIEVFVPPSADALLEPAAVAKLLGVSRAKLKTMVAAGDYPQCDVRVGANSPRWTTVVHNAWIRAKAGA